jgi:hypothetical protein
MCRFVTTGLLVSRMGVALSIVGTFSAERRRWVQKPHFCGWSRWVSKREIRLGDIRSGKNGVDAVETVTKRVKMGRENGQANVRCLPVRLRKNWFTSLGGRGGWTNPYFNRWVDRSPGSCCLVNYIYIFHTTI